MLQPSQYYILVAQSAHNTVRLPEQPNDCSDVFSSHCCKVSVSPCRPPTSQNKVTCTSSRILTCYTEKATKAWRRQQRQKQWHNQNHQQTNQATTKQPTNNTINLRTKHLTQHTHQPTLHPYEHTSHNAPAQYPSSVGRTASYENSIYLPA